MVQFLDKSLNFWKIFLSNSSNWTRIKFLQMVVDVQLYDFFGLINNCSGLQ